MEAAGVQAPPKGTSSHAMMRLTWHDLLSAGGRGNDRHPIALVVLYVLVLDVETRHAVLPEYGVVLTWGSYDDGG